MDITYRIPSKKVPYGYIEFTWKRESGTGMPDPAEMAAEYAQYIKDYQAAEVAAFEAAPTKPKVKVEDTSVEEATKILDEGLDGVTEVNESDPPAPWDKSSDETESTEEKPWDLDDSDWDM
jgi:hypothetical protein